MTKHIPEKETKVVEGKVFALLSYLSILCIIPLIFKKENDFVFFHGKQGLVIFIAQVAIFILSIILPVWFCKLGWFILLCVAFFGILAVLAGKETRLPVVAGWADKISL